MSIFFSFYESDMNLESLNVEKSGKCFLSECGSCLNCSVNELNYVL